MSNAGELLRAIETEEQKAQEYLDAALAHLVAMARGEVPLDERSRNLSQEQREYWIGYIHGLNNAANIFTGMNRDYE